VTFASVATNLVAGDTNGYRDIFIHDRQTGETTRVSVDSLGAQANGHSYSPSVSADGRCVAFSSLASDLVAGDSNALEDIFVHDRLTGTTTRVNVDSLGAQAGGTSGGVSISADARYVAFGSSAADLVAADTNGSRDIFVHDRQTAETARVSVDSFGTEGNGNCYAPTITADGRYVAFESDASNLVTGDANSMRDIFVHDRQTGETTRVSVNSGGTEGSGNSQRPSTSSDGRYVAFMSFSSDLVTGDTNGFADVFVHDRQTGETTRVSVDSAGTEGNGESSGPSISADGRYVAFHSSASNLVAGDTNGYSDIFVHDWQTGETTRVSVSSEGVEGNDTSSAGPITSDGRHVAFDSKATNLVAGDTNAARDIFVAPNPLHP
jgi:Tol biopolymer transport system component